MNRNKSLIYKINRAHKSTVHPTNRILHLVVFKCESTALSYLGCREKPILTDCTPSLEVQPSSGKGKSTGKIQLFKRQARKIQLFKREARGEDPEPPHLLPQHPHPSRILFHVNFLYVNQEITSLCITRSF